MWKIMRIMQESQRSEDLQPAELEHMTMGLTDQNIMLRPILTSVAVSIQRYF